MTFPFQARCIEERTSSPLCEGEAVPVVGITDEVVSCGEKVVLVEWMDREFSVPLSQLEVLNVDQDTRDTVDDWHYWNGDNGRLG
nr:calcium-binding protein [Halorubrum tropicale]